MIATLTENDLTSLKEGLRRCSPSTIEAAIHYRKTGDLQAIPAIVYGIIERYQSATAPVKLSAANESARLVEDIGLDSLTLLEIVLSIEEVLQIRIENEELRGIRTVSQLNQFLRSKITGGATAAPVKRYTREQIALALPQQPPFLFLDDAELNGASIKASYTIKGNEFFLEGHFKDEPVFPASIVFEAMGQAACLWLIEKAPGQLGKEIKPNRVLFASLDGAHFYRKTKPGEKLEFEQKLLKLREPLAIFEGTVTSNGQRVARVERLVLAFGEMPPGDSADGATVLRRDADDTTPLSPQPAAVPALASPNGQS